MEDVREYLHLYLGQDLVYTEKGPIPSERCVLTSWNLMWAESGISDGALKPILRRLDSMTEEEAKEFFKLHSTAEVLKLRPYKNGIVVDYRWIPDKLEYANDDGFGYSSVGANAGGRYTSSEFVYLLSKGFWLFDISAFDKGLIIDSKTLNKEV